MEGLFKIVIIFCVVVFCVSFSSSADSSLDATTPRATLTTAQVRGTGLPKPTNWPKRINVEPGVVAKFSSTPYDLFGAVGAQRRSNLRTMFQWDYMCQAQPMTGDCTRQAVRNQGPMTQNYYYDVQTDECNTFTYSGCGGNKNNFKSKVECERHCKGTNHVDLQDTTTSPTFYCTLQPNVGMCLGLLRRYYYDEKSNDCKAFVYGGCGGNQNRFDAYDLCIKRCEGDYIK